MAKSKSIVLNSKLKKSISTHYIMWLEASRAFKGARPAATWTLSTIWIGYCGLNVCTRIFINLLKTLLQVRNLRCLQVLYWWWWLDPWNFLEGLCNGGESEPFIWDQLDTSWSHGWPSRRCTFECAHCILAGLAETCSHVTAILYWLETAVHIFGIAMQHYS